MRRTKKILLAFLAFILLPGGADGDDHGARLDGRVFQKMLFGGSHDLRPLPYVKVRLTHGDAGDVQLYVCGSSGRFVFPNLPPGAYRLEAGLEGFRTARKEVEIVGDTHLTVDLTMFPGVDRPEALERLRAEDYELLVFQVSSPTDRSFRLALQLHASEATATLSEEIGDLGEASFEQRLSAENRARLRTLLGSVSLLEVNHRGSYARPVDLPYETLEVLGAGLVAIIVVSGNPEFEEGAGRELIEFLYGLSKTVVKQVGKTQPAPRGVYAFSRSLISPAAKSRRRSSMRSPPARRHSSEILA
ncbi:MAG: carboxypeptidase regulatory-like domain-containing protein [bacterium]|nr:carboxypeptidase regulatory-like domain-containing protein [bacterium]